VLDHVSIQCTDLVASAAFYDVVLEPLGGQRIMDFGNAIGYGVPPRSDFWIGAQATGDGFRESHIAFTAPSRAAVRAFFDVAVAEGATVLHEPRLWPEYHATYFGAFVRDPDGNNIEAVCHLTELPVLLAEQRGELFRRDDPVAFGHELTDLRPVGAAGKQHHDAVTVGSCGVERVAGGQQRLPFLCSGPQHQQRNGFAGRALPRHEQAERPAADVERVRRRPCCGQ
jgi:catechol 2,3-dioxygenase-like lactoylglutathione lyase family enzyme